MLQGMLCQLWKCWISNNGGITIKDLTDQTQIRNNHLLMCG
jgi:hypothetical protein